MPSRPWTALTVVVCLLLAGCATPDSEPGTKTTVETSFEDGLSSWTRNSDVPDDPNREGQVAWEISSSTERARTGERSVAFFLDGSQDDGTIWITQPLRVEQDQRYRAEVSAWAYSSSESFNTIAHLVMHLGARAPTAEEDFPPPGENTTADGNETRGGLRQDLNQQEGFKRYSFSWTVPAGPARDLYASVGISAVWETEMTYHVDDLSIELTRLPSDGGRQGGSDSPY